MDISLSHLNFNRYLMNKFHYCDGAVYAIGGTAQGQNIECFKVTTGKWTTLKSYRDQTEDTMYKWAAIVADSPPHV